MLCYFFKVELCYIIEHVLLVSAKAIPHPRTSTFYSLRVYDVFFQLFGICGKAETYIK